MKKQLALVLTALALLAPACVSRSQIKVAHDKGFQEADAQCVQLQRQVGQYLTAVQVELAGKNERLRQFNQLNEDGSLRYGSVSEAKKTKAPPAKPSAPSPEVSK